MIKKIKKQYRKIFKELKEKYQRIFTELNESYIIPDNLWEIIKPILTVPKKKTKRGAPRTHDYPIII